MNIPPLFFRYCKPLVKVFKLTTDFDPVKSRHIGFINTDNGFCIKFWSHVDRLNTVGKTNSLIDSLETYHCLSETYH